MSTPSLSAPATPGAWPMYRAMVGIGLLCGLLIVTVFQFTRPIIAEKRAAALQRAIFQVLPSAESSRTFRWVEQERFEPVAEGGGAAVSGPLVYAGYDAEGRLSGLAIEADGMGYQDVITVLYGYSFEREAIVGLQVLESKETPGLGTKIETDPGFRANFEELDVSLAPSGELAHPIEVVKSGEKESPWQIDAITGATISSNAIGSILGKSTRVWIPRIQPRQTDFTGKGSAS